MSDATRRAGILYSKLTGDKVADVEYVLTERDGRIWIVDQQHPAARFIGDVSHETGAFIYTLHTSTDDRIDITFQSSTGDRMDIAFRASSGEFSIV